MIKLIHEWHGHHTDEYCREELGIERCAIYHAIQEGVSDYELLRIAEDVDPELRDLIRG
jgi:hypothetical protein